jgi:hypothetical protein
MSTATHIFTRRFALVPLPHSARQARTSSDVLWWLHRAHIGNSLCFCVARVSLFSCALSGSEPEALTNFIDAANAGLLIISNALSMAVIYITSSSVFTDGALSVELRRLDMTRNVMFVLFLVEVVTFLYAAVMAPLRNRFAYYAYFFIVLCVNRVVLKATGWFFVRKVQQTIAGLYDTAASGAHNVAHRFTFFVRFQQISTALNLAIVIVLLMDSAKLLGDFDAVPFYHRQRVFDFFPPLVRGRVSSST